MAFVFATADDGHWVSITVVYLLSLLLRLIWTAFSRYSWTIKMWSAFSRYSWTIKMWSAFSRYC